MKTNAISEFYSSLKYFLTNYRRRTIAVFLAALVLAMLEMVSASMLLPLMSLSIETNVNVPLLGYIKNLFSSAGVTFNFYSVFFVFIFTFATKIVLELVFGVFIDMSSILIARNFRTQIINGLKTVSWGYLAHKPHGLLVNLMTQEIDRATGIFNMLTTVTISGLMMLIYLVLGVTVSPQLLIAAALMGFAAVFVARPMFSMARRAGAGHVENLRNLSADLLQGIQAYKVFKAMARERQLLAVLTNSNDAFVDANRLRSRAQRFLTASQQFVLIIAAVFGIYVARDILGIGMAEIGFMGIIMLRLNSNLANLLKKFQAIANVHYSLEKFEEFQQEIVEHSEPKSGSNTPKFPSPIYLDKVTFKYGERVILDKVTLEIPPKGLTAIMGPSGSGKTTVIDLICGFHQPASGRILVGDDELSTLNLRKWRGQIGYVTQESNLLNKTIFENVSAFDDTIGETEVIDALKQAEAWSFVQKLENGLNSMAGEAGTGLSGGERQRISIARAIASKPKLLILDEPTAAVDHATAQELIKTLAKLKQSIPIIVVTHQPAMTSIADNIYHFEHGKIVQTKNSANGKTAQTAHD